MSFGNESMFSLIWNLGEIWNQIATKFCATQNPPNQTKKKIVPALHSAPVCVTKSKFLSYFRFSSRLTVVHILM
jgi:hypothetical protein